MAFRSHLGRSFDRRSRSNQLLLVILVGSGVAALWRGAGLDSYVAPAHAFVTWALVREVDPDHDWSALVAGVGASLWVLGGRPVVSAFAVAGLMVAARIVTGTTGRRLLPIDLAWVTVMGIGISFSVAGWMAGFGLALALYIDDRFSGESRRARVVVSAATAIGVTVVATAASVFPERLPDVEPPVVIAAGVIALALVAREPAPPRSPVDARHGALLDQSRLHRSRSMIAVLVFGAAFFTGAEASGLLPAISALAIAVLANELELRHRGPR